jgi:hypothetical protein
MKQKLLVICVMSFSLLSAVPYANSCSQCGGNSKSKNKPQANFNFSNGPQYHVGSASRSKSGRPEFNFSNGPV